MTDISSRRLAPVCAALLVAFPACAWAADDPNPYTLGIVETLMHDSNVFRAPSGPLVSADWLSTTGLIGSIFQPIGRETFKANGEFDLDRFDHNKQLNSTAHSYSLEGDWATIGHLSGEVGYSNSSQLYRYNLSDTAITTAKNTQDTTSEFARFHLGVVTRWTIDAAVEGYHQTYSADLYKYRDLKRYDASLGTSYQASQDLRTSLTFRRTRGQYPNYLPTESDDFTRDDIIAGIFYNATGVSVFNLNVSSAKEDHSAIDSRSFHSWAADGRWIWTPTGRTQVTVDFSRDDDTGSTDVVTLGNEADARRRTSVSTKVVYGLTGKISLNGNVLFSKRNLDGAFAAIPTFSSAGSDRLYQAGVGFTYAATRAIQLGCNAAHEKRTVQGAPLTITYPYTDSTYSCTAQFVFN